MKVLGVIPARYASSRFPGKPLADIAGKPMIQRVYEQCQQSENISRLVVATDDQRIFDTVIDFGGKAVMTCQSHQSGTDRCFEALQKQNEHFDAVVNIQGDEPLINPQQIDQLVRLLENENATIATLAFKIRNPDELYNPNVVKVVCSKQGKALYFSRCTIPFLRDMPEKATPDSFPFLKHIGLYAYSAESLKTICAMPPSLLEKAESLEQLRWLENGLTLFVGVTEYQNIGVDTPEDLEKLRNFF